MNFLPLQKSEDLEAAIAASMDQPVLLFKHSATCSISKRAEHRMMTLTEEGDPAIYQLIVQRARNLSNAIAEQFQIRHESPQIILLHEGEAVLHGSHEAVNVENVRHAIQAIQAETE
jgi:bacillithiol system protein YtxJ